MYFYIVTAIIFAVVALSFIILFNVMYDGQSEIYFKSNTTVDGVRNKNDFSVSGTSARVLFSFIIFFGVMFISVPLFVIKYFFF